MPRYQKTSREYPAQYNEVAMLALSPAVRGRVIAVWQVGPADEQHRKLASATVHKFNRYRNLLWQEESPYAVACKDLSVTKVEYAGLWHVTFTMLNEYSQEEKSAGVSGNTTARAHVAQRMVQAQPPEQQVDISTLPISPQARDLLEKEQKSKDFWAQMERENEAGKVRQREERQHEVEDQVLTIPLIDPEDIVPGGTLPENCRKHLLNELTNSCILCNTPRAEWK